MGYIGVQFNTAEYNSSVMNWSSMILQILEILLVLQILEVLQLMQLLWNSLESNGILQNTTPV